MSEEPPHKKTPTEAPPDDGRSERPTLAPPFDVEAFARRSMSPASRRYPTDAPTEIPPPQDARSQQITLTNEFELEKARAESVRLGRTPEGNGRHDTVSRTPEGTGRHDGGFGEPPRHRTPSALSIVNARIPSSPALAAPRAPTPTSIEAAVLGVVNSSPPPEITERTIDDPVAEMRERFSLGDYTGALEMAELILADDADEPGLVEAAECAENCRTVLEKMYAARLGPLNRAPVVIVPRAQLRWLSLDHRAGFVLSLIDGTLTVEMILDLSGMPRIDALRILVELVQQKVVGLK